jgi:hypothetical protein
MKLACQKKQKLVLQYSSVQFIFRKLKIAGVVRYEIATK